MLVKLLAAATLAVGAFVAAPVTPDKTATVDPTVDPTVAAPTCCMKKAYCCTVTPKPACCKSMAVLEKR